MSPTKTVSPTIKQFQVNQKDTGSPQVQVALLTERIAQLSGHLQTHRKDFSSRQGLLKLVSRRRRMLEYLKRSDEPSYRSIIDALSLRK